MTKADRDALGRLIRQRFKVLRRDVEARRAELHTELEARIKAMFAAEDKAWADAMFIIQEAAREANRKANDALRALGREDLDLDGKEFEIVTARSVNQPVRGRYNLRHEGEARIDAQVKTALAELERRENDLLTRLLVGGLETEEARAFLGEIPTVSALVPTDRLLQLEQSLRDGDGDG